MKQANNIVFMDVVMFKNIFIAAAIMMASPSFVTAQDIFWSFSPTEVQTAFGEGAAGQGDSGSMYIFSDGLFGFDALDLVFETSNSNVVRFTGGEVFNPTFDVVGGERFHEPLISTNTFRGRSSGRLFLTNLGQNGVNPALSPLDPGFDAGVGPNGAVLLARVDFSIVGNGTADLEFSLGELGAFRFPGTELNPAFGVAVVSIQNNVFLPDIFWSFSPTEFQPTFPDDLIPGETGSAYIFSDWRLGFDAIDLDFAVSDSSVIRFTGGEAFDPSFNSIGGHRWNSHSVDVDTPVGDAGNLDLINIAVNGINPALSSFDPYFEPGVGPNGAFLLARVDFEILADGEANLQFSLGTRGILRLPDIVLNNPTFGSADFGCNRASLVNLGDVDLDGAITLLDIAPFTSVLSRNEYQLEADCNEDCAVNFLDIFPFIEILGTH